MSSRVYARRVNLAGNSDIFLTLKVLCGWHLELAFHMSMSYLLTLTRWYPVAGWTRKFCAWLFPPDWNLRGFWLCLCFICELYWNLRVFWTWFCFICELYFLHFLSISEVHIDFQPHIILVLFIFPSYKDFINIILHRQSLRGIIISHCAQLIAFLLLCNLWTPCTLSIVLCISFRITFMKQLIYYVRYFLALFFIYFSFITHFSRSISLSSTSTLTFL